ncbi:hypothetical protein ACQ4PT_005461 [Festuca glaucescens]
MDCEVFNHGVEYGHGPSQGNTYTVTEPDDDEYYRNDLCSETELSQEFLVNEIRKIWLADVCTFDDDDIIVIQSTVIMNPGSVKDTFAIPCGELPIATEDEDGKLAFLAQFALTDVPPIKYFGRMAMSDDLPDDVFKRCFMAVTLGSFLCPTSSTKPSTKYLGALVDVDNIKFLNWCKLVHDWLVCCIKKYKKDKMKVRYLDFVEFGSIMLPATLPRISVWKGDLIKHFSNMVIARTGSYNLYHEYFLEKWPNEYMKEIWRTNVIKGFQGADSARKLHLSERLNFPSLYDRHWFLFAVDMKARKFLFMDSLFGEHSDLHQEVDDRITVPCFVRKQFNNLVGNIFYVAAPDEVQYKFNVKKGDSKTRVCGSGYEKFVCDYDLQHGDTIMIDFNQAPELFGIVPQELPTIVVHTKGLSLTMAQTLKKEKLLCERGLGMGPVFVHTLTDTDVKGNGLRIPKEVLRSLNVEETGLASFYVNDYGYHPKGAYYTTTDGRMKFESCWAEFVKEYDMEAGNIILILFHMGGTGVINISVDRI